MYIQVSERCNMDCDHCCFSATRTGEDMSRETYADAIYQACRFGEPITIGGGEPTLNKQILDFVKLAAEKYRTGKLDTPPLIITNGKLYGKTHKLLDLWKSKGCFAMELSQDDHHEPITPAVVGRFREMRGRCAHGDDYCRLDIRTVKLLGPWGRAADRERGLLVDWNRSPCLCDDLFISPDGTIWSCGCKKHKLGHVSDYSFSLDEYDRNYAHEGGRNPDEVRESA